MLKMNPVTALFSIWFFTCVAGAIAVAQIPPAEIKPEKPRVVNIIGDIKAGMAVSIVNQLKQLDKENNKEIVVNITSYGGEVYAAFQIVDEMKAVKSPVHTVCEGYCMSAAALILSSGSKGLRESMPNASIMIHQVSSQLSGNIGELEKSLQEAERLNSIMLGLLEKNTGLSHEQIKEMTSFDDFLSPEQAMQYGLIDNVKTGTI